MPTYSSDRRSLLKIIGSIGATCAYPFAGDELFGQTVEAHQHAQTVQESEHFLRDGDFRTLSRITDLIIPETDTPGAIGAGVPDFVDRVISQTTDHQNVVADGLRWLDEEGKRTGGRPFIELTEEQQLQILLPLCEASDNNPQNPARNVQFFTLIKSLTADGYYTSKVGLMEELGYQGNKVRASYPACTDAQR
jgi:hypothetical protein